jgi:hypothetical protein
MAEMQCRTWLRSVGRFKTPVVAPTAAVMHEKNNIISADVAEKVHVALSPRSYPFVFKNDFEDKKKTFSSFSLFKNL